MNLRQAYDGWSQQEQNRTFYVRTREAFRKAWFTLPTNKPCSWYTKDVLALALAETRVVESDKVKAASVMIHVLTWANFAEPKWNPKPTFQIEDVTRLMRLSADELEKEREKITAAMQYELIEETEQTALAAAAIDAQPVNHGDCPTDSSEAEIEGTVPCDSHRPDEGETMEQREPNDTGINLAESRQSSTESQTSDDADPLAGIDFDDPKEVANALMEQSARIMNDKPKNPTNMEEKKQRGRAPMPVAQLHPETFEVIKVWPSRSEAEREIGACNLDRAIARKRMSAGFYWCAPEDADGFKPNPMSKFAPKSKMQPKPKRGKEAVETLRKALTEHTVSLSEGGVNHGGQSPCSPSLTTRTGDSPHDSRSAAEKALAVFTDDELLEELDRRGWEGELSRRQVVTIGDFIKH